MSAAKSRAKGKVRAKRRKPVRGANVVPVALKLAVSRARALGLALVDAERLARRPRPPFGIAPRAGDLDEEIAAIHERLDRIEGVLSRKDLL